MTDYFPFAVEFVNDAEQMYRISADFEEPALAAYKALFDRYGAQQRMLLVDITFAIIDGSSKAELAEHVKFDEEGYLLDMYVDSAEALQQFATVVCPVYQQLEQLEQVTRRVAGSQPPRSRQLLRYLPPFLRRIFRT